MSIYRNPVTFGYGGTPPRGPATVDDDAVLSGSGHRRLLFGGLLAALALCAPLRSQDLLAQLELETIATGLARPVAITHADDSRLFVTLQDGRIVILEGTDLRSEPFLDIEQLVRSGGERGLLSTAFHPRYDDNGFFFVNYTDLEGDTVIARYRRSLTDPNRADPASGVVLLRIEQPFSNHNGGQLQFGPDGFLYIGMGDGGSANDPQCNAQRSDTLLGKMLRIDVDQNAGQEPFFGIPDSNPFLGDPAFADEVWAVGLRNPWRFSFDRLLGDLYIADVGQNAREEVNRQPASSPGGENYGWKVMEGNLCLGSTAGCPQPPPGCASPLYTGPLLDYDHGGGNCSITGGYVYRGAEIPGLEGTYFYADFCSGRAWAVPSAGPASAARLLSFTVPGVTTFGEDASGELLIARESGVLSRLRGPSASQPGDIRLTAESLSVREGTANVILTATRMGGSDGAASVTYRTRDGSALAGEDYVGAAGRLEWADGEEGARNLFIRLEDDVRVEPSEDLELELTAVTGGATLASPARATIEIVDDDLPPGPCQPGPEVLCLLRNRFRIAIDWREFEQATGAGRAVPLTTDSGYFWFFDDTNVEVLVKLLDACTPPFERFWFFAAGLTNVETTISVADTSSREVRIYRNDLGIAFVPVQDVKAFATCP